MSYGDAELNGKIKINIIKDRDSKEGDKRRESKKLYENPGSSFLFMDDEYTPYDSVIESSNKSMKNT